MGTATSSTIEKPNGSATILTAPAAVVKEGHVFTDQPIAKQALDRPREIPPADRRLVTLDGRASHVLAA